MARKKKVEDSAAEAAAQLAKPSAVRPPRFDLGLSSGSTLLNLAVTGRPGACFLPGTYNYVVGASNSGKSWILLTALAEAAMNPAYDGYRFIYDNPEGGAQVDVSQHFGQRLASRLRAPVYHGARPWYSERIEEFYVHLTMAMRDGPCVYLLDSMDALTSQQEADQFGEMAKAVESDGADAKFKGNYGDGKAKKNSSLLRQVLPRIDETGSILLVIGQRRENLRSPFGGGTHSGGNAIWFFAQTRFWTKVRQDIYSGEINGQKRHVGNLCEFHVERSRYTGHEAKVELPFHFTGGIDDIGSCVDYLLQEKYWSHTKGVIDAKDFGVKARRSDLIERIELENQEEELRRIVTVVWNDVLDRISVRRKQRYL